MEDLKEQALLDIRNHIDSARKDLYRVREELFQMSKKYIFGFVAYVFLNILMIVWYEQERSILNVILQTVHMVGITIMCRISFPTFMAIRSCNIQIKNSLKRLKKQYEKYSKI